MNPPNIKSKDALTHGISGRDLNEGNLNELNRVVVSSETEDQGVWIEEASETFVVDYTKIQ